MKSAHAIWYQDCKVNRWKSWWCRFLVILFTIASASSATYFKVDKNTMGQSCIHRDDTTFRTWIFTIKKFLEELGGTTIYSFCIALPNHSTNFQTFKKSCTTALTCWQPTVKVDGVRCSFGWSLSIVFCRRCEKYHETCSVTRSKCENEVNLNFCSSAFVFAIKYVYCYNCTNNAWRVFIESTWNCRNFHLFCFLLFLCVFFFRVSNPRFDTRKHTMKRNIHAWGSPRKERGFFRLECLLFLWLWWEFSSALRKINHSQMNAKDEEVRVFTTLSWIIYTNHNSFVCRIQYVRIERAYCRALNL